MIFRNLVIMLVLSCAACNMSKEIEVDLPEYEPQAVVECYLEAGQPYRMALTKSSGYFDEVNDTALLSILIHGALVLITHANGTDTLQEAAGGVFVENGRLFNYISSKTVPTLYNSDFSLKIITADNKEISAVTRLLPPVPIDSLTTKWSTSNDTLALVLTHITDPADTDNYYRRQFFFGSRDSVQQDFFPDDRIVGENNQLVFGSGYDFTEGDTALAVLWHINKEYADYAQSTQTAIASNGNPFASPGSILSNIQGGIGIFTGVSRDEKSVIIHK
ncbi:MAG: DUF4249 domain-containing protein [Sphingobacteriales bacterium]|nr:DUF4249 domain-containing protein [Sphingobacteriales bacterium]